MIVVFPDHTHLLLINTGVCHRFEFDDFTLINCLEYDFFFTTHLIFNAIPLLIYDVMYDITTTT